LTRSSPSVTGLASSNRVKEKLLRQSDPATGKLVTALEEIYKIFASLEDEIPQFLALQFDAEDQPSLAQERAKLIALEGGEIGVRMGQARGHCSKISNIYQRHLSPWFDRVLPKTDTEQIAVLFQQIHEFDSEMVVAIDRLADWLTREASEVLSHDAKRYEAAQKRIQDARASLLQGNRKSDANTPRLTRGVHWRLGIAVIEGSGNRTKSAAIDYISDPELSIHGHEVVYG
jgi:hypothetical protein